MVDDEPLRSARPRPVPACAIGGGDEEISRDHPVRHGVVRRLLGQDVLAVLERLGVAARAA